MKNIVQITYSALLAASLIVLPAVSRADDATNAPAAQTSAPKKSGSLPFHGKVVAVDTAAMTFTVGTMTIAITSSTRISKDGKPAILADMTAGDAVRGAYKKDTEGKLNATIVRIGQVKKPVAPATPATPATPAAPAAPPAQ